MMSLSFASFPYRNMLAWTFLVYLFSTYFSIMSNMTETLMVQQDRNMLDNLDTFVPVPATSPSTTTTTTTTTTATASAPEERCAINLYGLPRSFKLLVLPSLIQNVLLVNAKYGCDYFVHYHERTAEAASRSLQVSSAMDPTEIRLLQQAVDDVAMLTNPLYRTNHRPVVRFVSSTDQDIWNRHGALLNETRTAMIHVKMRLQPDQPRQMHHVLRYHPVKDESLKFPETTDNIIKMWHSQQSAWQLMQQTARALNYNYTRVAMFRNDVVFVTPIDIYHTAASVPDWNNEYAVIPNFGYPINDRMIYGPAAAVELWATKRFELLEEHLQNMEQYKPGFGMHSERYLYHTLFPLMRGMSFEEYYNQVYENGSSGAKVTANRTSSSPPAALVKDVQSHDGICFLRARADESVWVSDCGNEDANVKFVQNLIGRKCRLRDMADPTLHFVKQLRCKQLPREQREQR